jgi:hypothetical protein
LRSVFCSLLVLMQVADLIKILQAISFEIKTLCLVRFKGLQIILEG